MHACLPTLGELNAPTKQSIRTLRYASTSRYCTSLATSATPQTCDRPTPQAPIALVTGRGCRSYQDMPSEKETERIESKHEIGREEGYSGLSASDVERCHGVNVIPPTCQCTYHLSPPPHTLNPRKVVEAEGLS